MKKLIYIEWARGIAALMVVLHHATLDAPTFYDYKPFENFFYFGMAGVDFFFVLSGFIIYYIHSEDTNTTKSIKKYILKRLIRIYPIFIFVSSLLFIAYLISPNTTNRIDLFNLSFLLKSFLLLPSSVPPLLTVSWTLTYEMFFYLIFIVFFINKKIGFFIFILWGGIIIFLSILNKPLYFPYNFFFNLHNLEFLFGVLVSFIFKTNKNKMSNKNLYLILYSSLFIFILNGINQNYHIININTSYVLLLYGISSSIILYGLVHLPQVLSENRILQILSLLGAASYSIYLIHVPLLSILHRIITIFHLQLYIHPNLLFLSLATLSVIGGIIMHLIIEKPIILYLKNKFIYNK